MRFHCLGVGSIGTLLATNLAQVPSTQVRLVLRRKNLAQQLANQEPDGPVRDSHQLPTGTLTVERNGLARRTPNLEMELTRSPQDAWELEKVKSKMRTHARIDPRLWNRQDWIQTLVISTKAPQTIPAMKHLLGRLNSRSVIFLCQNGMGILESLLEKYWPEDRSDSLEAEGDALRSRWGSLGGRPSFVCATTSHGAWRKGSGHIVHAGLGDLKFGVLPNRAVLSTLAQYPDPPWGNHADNPLLNPRSLVQPDLDRHLPYTPATANLHGTLAALLACNELRPAWLPLPSLQVAQLQKLAVNSSVNALTALTGVNNGALVGSQKAKRLIEAVCRECADVFAAHLAREEGTWAPPAYDPSSDNDDSSSLSFALPRVDSHPPPPPLPPSHPLSSRSLLDYTQRVLFKTAPNLSSTLSDLISLNTGAPHAFSLTENAPSLPTRTEIEYINGYVVALGRKYGVRTETVRALGELVLLKEEMGRVGAVDRVWAGRRGRETARSGSSSPSREDGEGAGAPERPATLPRARGSIFAASPSPSPERKPTPYQRAAEQIAQTQRRREGVAASRSRERSEDDGVR